MNESPTKVEIKVTPYRWVIIAIYGIYCGINFFQFLQFTIIANIVERYYEVNSLVADCTGLVFMAFFVLLFIPIGHFIEQHDLKISAVFSSGLTAFANSLKLLAVPQNNFYLILISQSLCGIAQVFMLSIPSKVASIWFGSEEVSIACAIGLTGCQIGLALGALAPSLFVPDTKDIAEIGDGFNILYIVNAATSIAIFVIVVLFFQSKPEHPPSKSQAALVAQDVETKMGYLEAFRGFMKNSDFLLVLFCFGLPLGIWTSLGVFVNQLYLHFFPDGEKELGLIVLSSIISGGIFGNLIFGYIMDKTHEFKKVAFIVLTLNCITWILSTIALQSRSHLAAYLSIPLNGFFSTSLMVVSFEFAIETTYPVPEAFGASLLNAIVYVFAIIYVLIIELMFNTIGYLAAQMFIAASYALTASAVMLISSDFKRRDANLLSASAENYDTFSGEGSGNIQ